MSEKKKLLVVLDYEAENQPALDRALFLARQSQAELELFVSEFSAALYAHMAVTREGDELSPDAYLREVESWLFKLAEPLREQGLTVHTDSVWNRHQYAGILEKVASSQPDLVIKATAHDSRLHRTLFNYTDWHLIRECGAPLLLVKSEDDWHSKRIIASVDPAHVHGKAEQLDANIMAAACDWARDTGGELHVFHSIELLPEPVILAGPYNPTYEDYQGMVETASKEQLDRFMQDYPEVSESRVHLREGKPEDTLPVLVRELQASLVVMGAISRGHRGLLLIGSTAENVLDDLACDILVIKPDADESDS